MARDLAIRPAYVTTSQGQLRVWQVGEEPPCVVLPGLINGAEVIASRLAASNPPVNAVVVELPGLGGSAGVWPSGISAVAGAVAAALQDLGLTQAPVLALDLCLPVAAAISGPGRPEPVGLHAAAARLWAAHRRVPPLSEPMPDGTHLTALFAFLRNGHVLDPVDWSCARSQGDALPDAAALNATLVAAAIRPGAFAALWQACMGAMAGVPARSCAENWNDAIRKLGAAATPAQPAATFVPPKGVRRDYTATPGGRMHLRRAGPAGHRPVIALHSAPGSSAPLAGLIAALATDRDVVAPDYLGNGESDKPPGPVAITGLAQDVVALANALDLPQFDLWGTHTGALIALEAALIAPDRVGCAILEGPVLLPPSLNRDILAHYFPPLEPHPWGLHLQQAWNMRRDMFLFWPWYRAELAAARPLGVPDPAFLHDWTIGLLQSGASYHRSYRAAFEYDTPARLPLLGCRSLVCAGQADMLVGSLAIARTMNLPRVTVQETPATVWYPKQPPDAFAATIKLYRTFLDHDEGATA